MARLLPEREEGLLIVEVVAMSHHLATGHRDGLSGNGIARRKAEPGHSVCYFLGTDQALLWITRFQLGTSLSRSPAGFRYDVVDGFFKHLRLGEPGAHRVHGNSLSRQLQSQRSRQPDDRMLRRTIGGDVAVAHQPRSAGNVDNASPAGRKHLGQDRLGAIKRAIQIDLYHAAPEFSAGFKKSSGACLPGIVYQDVNGPEARPCRCQRGSQSRGIANIGLDVGCLVISPGHGIVFPDGVAAAEHGDARSMSEQRACDSGANTARPARNHRVLAGQIFCVHFHQGCAYTCNMSWARARFLSSCSFPARYCLGHVMSGNPCLAASCTVQAGSARCGRATAHRSARPAAMIVFTWSPSKMLPTAMVRMPASLRILSANGT